MKAATNAVWCAFALCWCCIASAQIAVSGAVPAAVPLLSGRIIDQTATLTTTQKAGLEQTLREFEARKGSQLAVLLVATTAPETIEQYALRVVEKWKLGRKKVDDGALLLIAKTDRTMRIEVGYGLEGALNDATCKRIISEIITPRFKEGDFNGGISAGVGQIIRVIDGEPLPRPTQRNRDSEDRQGIVLILFIFAVLIGNLLRRVLGRFPGAIITGAGVALLAWMFASALALALIAGALAFFFTLIGVGMGRMGGYGGGGFGGGGGGGFGGGGGGGGFGGGGASGKW